MIIYFHLYIFSGTIYPQMKSVVTFFSEVRSELSKVTWPKRKEVVRLTGVVILVSVIVGFYVGGFDYLFTTVLTKLIAK